MTTESPRDDEPTTIASEIEANMNAFWLSHAAVPGAILHDAPESSWVDSGYDWADFNAVVTARFAPERVDDGIASVVDHFRRHARRFIWHVGPSTVPADLGNRLLAHGLSFSEDEPGMAVELDRFGAPAPMPPGLTIEPVREERDLAAWVDVWLFPVEVAHRQPAVEVLRGRGIGDEQPWRLYLGRLDGVPVATSELFAHRTSVSVQYVVTVPDARRRGIGAAMTRRVLEDGRALGLDLGVLTASPDGIGVYRKLGFQEYCRIRRYEWEPTQP